jgi:carbon-monoxide dehydrogenase small subunit
MRPTDETDVRAALTIELHVNGTPREVEVEPRWTLADVLRDSLSLTGTHLGCEQGICGACTVLIDGEPVRACLMFAVQASGHEIRTIEGLGDGSRLHTVQEAFHEHHALQCGFCTPGFIMLAVGLLEREPDASPERIAEVVSSNLCRCTGYKPIVKAVLSAQEQIGSS